MRILIWTDAFLPEIGGLEVFCLRLVTELVRRGHDCAVVTNRRDPLTPAREVIAGIPVFRFEFDAAAHTGKLANMRAQVEACREVVDAFQPDLIHLNAHLSSIFYFLRQQRIKRRPAVLTLHDNYLFRPQTQNGSAVLGCVDAVAAISESIREDALAFDPALQPRLFTILNALPWPETAPLPPPEEPRILTFGRQVRDKGFDLAIEAFARIADRFPEATLTLAGDGEEHQNLRAQAAAKTCRERIHFLGPVAPDRIAELINEHALVIMPSRWKEPFGLVALETAQMSRPIIAARRGGIPEIVKHGETGLLFENENLPELTEALTALLADPSRRETLGRQARERAKEHFNFSRFVSAYEEIYARAGTAFATRGLQISG